MLAIKIGKAVGIADIAFVIESRIESSVASRSSIERLGESVGTLEIPCAPSTRERCLQRIVVRVSVIGEDLEAAIPIDTLQVGARRTVGSGAARDWYLRPILRGHDDRIGCRGQLGLDIGAGFAKVQAMRANVTHFQNPLLSEFALQGQIPLLRAGGHEVTRNGQNEQIVGWDQTGAAIGAAIVRELSGVVAGKILQYAETGYESGIENVAGGKSVEVGGGRQALRRSVRTGGCKGGFQACRGIG